ncbi:signal transduction histidine kinase [Pisolithus orientalis]|uniref:signal transduction histidine kinase n=1 Tax=Pisolithus orientalis TaxID=936130 RepID=UPI002224A2F1|nr:signal transduction histidine kinase [Pisolithus orientalis]KAI5995981.1 signal transduction histidine kinase [Pisolithus orientalis]
MSLKATKEIINKETFSQLQDLDDDETQEFSRGMVHDYFNQAETTFSDMDSAFAAKDLETLSSRGHFLKGSSAALGIVQVQAICEKIQHLGKRTDPDKGTDPDKRVESKEPELSRDEALAKIEPLLARVKVEHADAVRWLMEYYKALDS